MSVYIPEDPDTLDRVSVDFISIDLFKSSALAQSIYYHPEPGVQETSAYVEVSPEDDFGQWRRTQHMPGYVQQRFDGRCTIRIVFWDQGDRYEWVFGPGEYRRVQVRLLRRAVDGVDIEQAEEVYITDRTVR